jgi:hypothetical protein
MSNSKRTAAVPLVRRIKFESRGDLLNHLHFAGVRRNELNKLNKSNKK